MSKLIANDVASHWMEAASILPTRKLQLSFEDANASFDHLSDFSLVLSILRNEPAIVPPDVIATLKKLHEVISAPRYKAQAERLRRSRGEYSQTISPLKREMKKYIVEREQGIHQYQREQDYSIELIDTWMKRHDKHEVDVDFHVLGACDYIRVLARAIDNFSDKDLLTGRPIKLRNADPTTDKDPRSYKYASSPTIGSVLKDSSKLGGMNKKQLVKTLKSLARNAHLQSTSISEYQDVVMMLAKDKISIRPASFVLEAPLEIASSGGNNLGTVYNMLTEKSPVHAGEDPLLHFEDLLNSSTAGELDFQRFFEKYPQFLLGTDYNRLIAHPVLVREDEHNLIPDFIMIPHGFSAPKILDLKLPNVNIARHTPNREGFLQNVMSARDQLLEYRTYFASKGTSEYAREVFGCDIYLPKIAVLIGRSSYFSTPYERRKIESRVPDIEVITYDDIYERAKQCRTLSLL